MFGDPALLLPLVYPRKHENFCKNSHYVVIPHYTQDKILENNPNLLHTFVNYYKPFIDKMCSANLVVSFSLHGIILAEAYGIPAVLLRNPIEKVCLNIMIITVQSDEIIFQLLIHLKKH